VLRDVPARELTTFRLGGPCRTLILCRSSAVMTETLQRLARNGEAYTVLGDGSNVLCGEGGYDGTVVRFVAERPRVTGEGACLEVEAGARLDDFVDETVRRGLGGLVFCSGIPGTVGGAVAGNAGAFGHCVGDRLESVLLADRSGAVRREAAGALGLAYRSSRMQRTGEVVLAARFRLEPENPERLRTLREDRLALRAARHPDWRALPNAGSVFRNLEAGAPGERRRAAGWYLEQAGATTMRQAGARVFQRHANIIVKADENCTAGDVLVLSRRMRRAVHRRYGLTLTYEMRFVGSFENEHGAAGSGRP
jgi:UDP-N-acetylmuramate dehydrogenase